METWKIGDVEITRVVEVVTPTPATFLIPQAEPAAIEPLTGWLRLCLRRVRYLTFFFLEVLEVRNRWDRGGFRWISGFSGSSLGFQVWCAMFGCVVVGNGSCVWRIYWQQREDVYQG